ncbi:MAG TPA: SdrD B-like domain-containing protein, partial [Longimicrobiales bacterium]|nr:SdrD B-like domain-containing protein [Longimicrobiales bacterium]
MKRFKYMALAALVAFAACDEGTDVVVDVPVTGDIAGVVTIEGAAVSGVTVALSSGATTTTDGSGAYSFSGVAAGAYTITISGFAADATFSSTSKAATIVTTGQVATVNFDGAYVRTSAILGSVAAGGSGLAGVSVSIGSSTTQTDANGQYSFSGLRAGTYTVTVSGFNAQQYAFANSTQNVTLGVGESKVVSFNGQLLATSTIGGTLYIDGNANKSMDPGEPPVAKAGITVALERAIGDTIYTTTDANGMYAFSDLEEGTYKVILLDQATFPGAFTKTAEDRYLAAATSGGTTTVNFAFTVTTQYVRVYGMLGVDNVKAGVAPIKNWNLNLYPTDVDATAGSAPLVTFNSQKTDANGMVTFKFLRKNDFSPNKAQIDGIVFARAEPLTAPYAINGEMFIEIPWSPLDSMVMA